MMMAGLALGVLSENTVLLEKAFYEGAIICSP
jgi:hypothetical protein